jgi:lipopolysaccharide export system permease protein
MRILSRYLARIFFTNVVLAITGMSTLFYIINTIGAITGRSTRPEIQTIIFEALKIPETASQLIGPGTMLATILTLSMLNRSNELTAMFSIGLGKVHLAIIIASLAFIVSCFALVFQDRILPVAWKERRDYYWRVIKGRKDLLLDARRDRVWYRSEDLVFNLRNFDVEKSRINGLSIFSFNQDFSMVQRIDAEVANWKDGLWILEQGKVTVFPEESPVPLTTTFDEKEIKIKETPEDFKEIDLRAGGLRIKEYWGYIQRIKGTGMDTKSHEVRFHSRISFSFNPIVMALLVLPFSIRRRREGGMGRDLGLGLSVTFFYWLFYSIALSLGTNGVLPPWLAAWAPCIFFAALAVAVALRDQSDGQKAKPDPDPAPAA